MEGLSYKTREGIAREIKEILPEYLKEHADSALTKIPKIYTLKSWSSKCEGYWIRKGKAVDFLRADRNIVWMNHYFSKDCHGNVGKMNTANVFIDIEPEKVPYFWVYMYMYDKYDTFAINELNPKVYKFHHTVTDIWPYIRENWFDLSEIYDSEKSIIDNNIIKALAKYIIRLIEEDVELLIDKLEIVYADNKHFDGELEMYDGEEKLFTIKESEKGVYIKVDHTK